MQGKLLYLLADLMQDRSLRTRFNRNPDRVMDQYGLPAHAREALVTMNRNHIATMIQEEFDEWGFPDDGLEAHPEDEGVGPHYPDPDPAVFATTPRALDRNKPNQWKNRTRRGLRIRGQSFSRNLAVTLQDAQDATYEFPGLGDPIVRGTYRKSHVIVPMPPSPPAGVRATTYRLIVTINPGGRFPEPVVFENALTVS